MNAEELVERRKDRAIAIILRMKESECDEFLPAGVRTKLRKVILDQLNDLAEVVTDILKASTSDTVVVNEFWLEKLMEVHAVVTREDMLKVRRAKID